MKRFTSLLLTLDGSPEAAKGIGCALWIAETLGATLHVVHAATSPLPEHEALSRLHVPVARRKRIVLHQTSTSAEPAVLNAIAALGIDLVMMTARGESFATGPGRTPALGSVARAVIEHCAVPVLMFPVRYREVLPWTSALAAVSGSTAAGEALEAITQLASALHLSVRVLHVVDGMEMSGPAPLGAYADESYHEYPRRLEDMVERGLAGCTPEQCGHVEQVLLQGGDPAAVVLEQVARHPCNVLALGWRGALGTGRALVLKKLLEEAPCALLLVRLVKRSSARLKVGQEIDE